MLNLVMRNASVVILAAFCGIFSKTTAKYSTLSAAQHLAAINRTKYDY